jgi:hypothetical protein
MNDLAGQWIGTLYGTNHGNAFMEFVPQQDTLMGTIRFKEPGLGVIVYSAELVDGDGITFKLSPKAAPEGVALSDAMAQAILQPNGELTGRWEADNGGAGTFHFRRTVGLKTLDGGKAATSGGPEQAFFHTVAVGAVRLYHSDLKRIFDAVARDFVQSEPIVTYVENDVQVTKFASGFLQAPPARSLESLKISIQEPEPSGLVRLVNIDLLERAGSQVRTSGPSESWVTGKAHNLRALLAAHENRLVSWYRRYGLLINSLIFLILLVAAPEVDEWPQRAVLVGAIFGLLGILALIYNRFVPNTVIFASTTEPSLWARFWPSALSWLAAVTSSLVALWLFWFFTRDR